MRVSAMAAASSNLQNQSFSRVALAAGQAIELEMSPRNLLHVENEGKTGNEEEVDESDGGGM